VRLFTTQSGNYRAGNLRNTLRGSAVGLVAGFALMSCSGSETHVAGAQAPSAVKSAKVSTKEPMTEAATPPRLRLMTQDQYLNTLAYVFGPDIKPETHFAPVQRTDGLLALGTARAGVTDSQLELYQKTAALVAGMVVKPERRDFLIMCKPADEKAADKACAGRFLADIGRLLYRKPLPAAKVNELVEQASGSADKLKDFYAGLAVAIEAMLVSPNVLYIAETSEADPKHPGHQRLDAYSLASRLSFFLWNAAPDDAMLKAAETGDILTEKGRTKIVNMMLASPRLETGMRAFFDDMFAFDDFNNLAKDPMVYPSFTGVTVGDAREQTLRTVIDQLITKDKDYRDLFTTRETYMSPSLAALYRLPSSRTWTPYEFPADSPRVGLLTQISFLAVHSHPGRSSATLRGKALREVLLCQPVPRPPANVDFSIVENPNSNYKTARDRITAHRSNPVCAGCHKITDPMGLALENFDGAGRFRENEKGNPIDASGSLDGVEFKDAAGLGQALHDHPALTSCLAKRVFAYGTGAAAKSDETMKYINARFSEQGYRLPDLLRTIALSNAFSEVSETQTQAPVKSASAPEAQSPATISK
jgi:hypothetical protein